MAKLNTQTLSVARSMGGTDQQIVNALSGKDADWIRAAFKAQYPLDEIAQFQEKKTSSMKQNQVERQSINPVSSPSASLAPSKGGEWYICLTDFKVDDLSFERGKVIEAHKEPDGNIYVTFGGVKYLMPDNNLKQGNLSDLHL